MLSRRIIKTDTWSFIRFTFPSINTFHYYFVYWSFRHHPLTCCILLSFVFDMKFVGMVFNSINLISNIKSTRRFAWKPFHINSNIFMSIVIIKSKILIISQLGILQCISYTCCQINNNNFCIINPIKTTIFRVFQFS